MSPRIWGHVFIWASFVGTLGMGSLLGYPLLGFVAQIVVQGSFLLGAYLRSKT